MTHSPLSAWADRSPALRWTAVAVVLTGFVLLAYAAMGQYDEAQAVEDARLEAERDGHRQLLQQQALQAACGGPEATVMELAQGGYACLDTNGRKTKTIPGLARPANTTHGTAARAKGARLQREVLKSAYVNQSAGVVPAGFLKG